MATTYVRVRYADTDAMKNVYYANYLKWFEVGRAEFLRALGYPYDSLEKRGIFFPIMECSCSYQSPAYYDDLLEITTKVEVCQPSFIVFSYVIFRAQTKEVLCTGSTHNSITNSHLRRIDLEKLEPELYRLLESERA